MRCRKPPLCAQGMPGAVEFESLGGAEASAVSMCGPQPSNGSITLEVVRNAHSSAPLHTAESEPLSVGVCICVFKNPPCDSVFRAEPEVRADAGAPEGRAGG